MIGLAPPTLDIDLRAFAADPYPTLAEVQSLAPVVAVPQLDALLLTRRDTIFTQEKRVTTFSSHQPEGLMTVLMGENMMRKDGAAHAQERRATFPALSPRRVKDTWRAHFRMETEAILDALAPLGRCDLVKDYAMPVSGHALRHITGLTNLSCYDMDAISQAMIDGISNYTGDPEVEARCHAATACMDAAIDARAAELRIKPDHSLIGVQCAAGISEDSLRANVKLAVSGGQNEPRDAIAGTAWALLSHPDQRFLVQQGQATWRDAFEEYARWISPIGMSPRRIAQDDVVEGYRVIEGKRAFLMFSAANRDPRVFSSPDAFDIGRDTSKAIAFGAGPHFCAGAAAARCLIADVALPLLFERFSNLRLDGAVTFSGWAFRGPLNVPVCWDVSA